MADEESGVRCWSCMKFTRDPVWYDRHGDPVDWTTRAEDPCPYHSECGLKFAETAKKIAERTVTPEPEKSRGQGSLF